MGTFAKVNISDFFNTVRMQKYVSFFCKKLANKKSSLYLPNESTWPMLVMEVLFLFQRRSVSTTSSKKLIWESIWASELDFSQLGTSDNEVSRLTNDSVFDIRRLSTSSYIVDRESFDLRSESKIINKIYTVSDTESQIWSVNLSFCGLKL